MSWISVKFGLVFVSLTEIDSFALVCPHFGLLKMWLNNSDTSATTRYKCWAFVGLRVESCVDYELCTHTKWKNFAVCKDIYWRYETGKTRNKTRNKLTDKKLLFLPSIFLNFLLCYDICTPSSSSPIAWKSGLFSGLFSKHLCASWMKVGCMKFSGKFSLAWPLTTCVAVCTGSRSCGEKKISGNNKENTRAR